MEINVPVSCPDERRLKPNHKTEIKLSVGNQSSKTTATTTHNSLQEPEKNILMFSAFASLLQVR